MAGVIEKLKHGVQAKFIEIRKAIDMREKLLLRQIDVIATNQLSITTATAIDEIYFIPENEKDLFDCLRTFGKFNLDNINFINNDLFINEDYILPSIDHEIMHKCLNNNNSSNIIDEDNDENEKIIVNFSNNKKLIKKNVDNINESIINITLNEAIKLIEKTKITTDTTADTNDIIAPIIENDQSIMNFTIIDNDDDENDINDNDKGFFISQSSQTDGKKKHNHTNPNITINNCNGTINLKNISNLTINCVTQDSFNIPNEPEQGSSNSTVNNRQSIESDSQSLRNNTDSIDNEINSSISDDNKKQRKQNKKSEYNSTTSTANTTTTTKDSENNSVNCEFYDRLISEIKNTIKQSHKAPIEKIPLERKSFNTHFGGGGDDGGTGSSDSTITTTATTKNNNSYNRKLLLKNFENIKIVLENNENETHPVQIEQWLTEIISATEIEPMQTTEIQAIHSSGG